MLAEEFKCQSHAELDSASYKTLNQVQSDGALSHRVLRLRSV